MSLNLDLYHTANIVYPVETANKNYMLCNILLIIPVKKSYDNKKKAPFYLSQTGRGYLVQLHNLIT